MKAILKSEFGLVTPSFSVMIPIVIIFMCFASKTSAMVCALCAMWPLLLLFSLMSYDNANGWGRYRAALPFSRRDIIVGRYLSILLSSAGIVVLSILLGVLLDAVLPPFADAFETASMAQLSCSCVLSASFVLVLAACIQPFVIKFDYVKGMRFACAAFIPAFCLGLTSFEQFASEALLDQVFSWIDGHMAALAAGFAAVCLVANVVSCAVSLRIYEKKDL